MQNGKYQIHMKTINTMLNRIMADVYTPEGALRDEMLLDTQWIERDVRRCRFNGVFLLDEKRPMPKHQPLCVIFISSTRVQFVPLLIPFGQCLYILHWRQIIRCFGGRYDRMPQPTIVGIRLLEVEFRVLHLVNALSSHLRHPLFERLGLRRRDALY
jgi:hypothetical protein